MFCRPFFNVNLFERFQQTFCREVYKFASEVGKPFTKVSEIVVDYVQTIVEIVFSVLVVEVVVGEVHTEQTDIRSTQVKCDYDGDIRRCYRMIYK